MKKIILSLLTFLFASLIVTTTFANDDCRSSGMHPITQYFDIGGQLTDGNWLMTDIDITNIKATCKKFLHMKQLDLTGIVYYGETVGGTHFATTKLPAIDTGIYDLSMNLKNKDTGKSFGYMVEVSMKFTGLYEIKGKNITITKSPADGPILKASWGKDRLGVPKPILIFTPRTK